MTSTIPETRQSSILVAVRVRPFTQEENAHLIHDNSEFTAYRLGDATLTLPGLENTTTTKQVSVEKSTNRFKPCGIRKIVDCVDDKMLIFDPAENNPLNKISENLLNSRILQQDRTKNGRSSSSTRRYMRRSGEQKFVFDKLFDEDATQTEVYESTTRPLLDSVLDGFNGTIFAYGATGCGKTFTISGTPEQPGVIFLTMQELFQRIEDLKDSKHFDLTLSYLEIYNESIRDLLSPDISSKKLVIREDSIKGISVANLSHHTPQTVQDVMDLVVRGNMNRTTSPTDANETSSRSHAVLQIHVVQKNRTAELSEAHTFATLSIIDLAGSERASATKNRGERLHEGANINRSLLALGNCINALCVSGRRSTCHVPYRDSKLTRLLKFSLGGNCKTVMIVCIAPSSAHYDETLNTLKYANRAKEIKTKVIRNQHSLDRHVGSYLKMITEQRQEIEELRCRESKMVALELTKYKLAREKLQIAIWDSINGVKNNYSNMEKLQLLKTKKSLMLCKRRFLQMVSIELSNLMKLLAQDTKIYENCMALYDQLINKIRDLEEKFDTSDELDMAIEHTKSVDLVKLQEMETWDDSVDLPWFESHLNFLAESLRNEILVTASIMMERLFEDEKLISRYKFVSRTVLEALASKENGGADTMDMILERLDFAIKDLVQIDDEFEQFASGLRPPPVNYSMKAGRKLQSYRKPAKVVKTNNTLSPLSSKTSYSKHSKKVRWSESTTMSGNDSTMQVDDDSVIATSAQRSTPAGDININDMFEEDVSMQDAHDSQDPILHTRDLNRISQDKRKVSLTSTALRAGK